MAKTSGAGSRGKAQVTRGRGPARAFTGVAPRHRRAEMKGLKLQGGQGGSLLAAGPAGTTKQDLVTGEDGGVRLSLG